MTNNSEQTVGKNKNPIVESNGTNKPTPDLYIQSSAKLNGKVWGTLVVCEHAVLEGHVHAARIIIHGTTNGIISADEFIKISSTATVKGTLKTNNIHVENGAVCNFKAITGKEELKKDERNLSELTALRKVIHQQKYLQFIMKVPQNGRAVNGQHIASKMKKPDPKKS